MDRELSRGDGEDEGDEGDEGEKETLIGFSELLLIVHD
jgi:hypothetical protein